MGIAEFVDEFADVIDEFADALTDANSPPGADGVPGGPLARMCADPSRTGSADQQLLRVMVGLARTLNLSATVLAEVVDAAERAGIPR